MVTNINLVAPEEEKKTALSGKTTIVLSFSLLLAVLAVWLVLAQISRGYQSQQISTENQIQQEKNKISGQDYAALADFQERVDLLNRIIPDHSYFDVYLRNFSQYLLPGVSLINFKWDSSGDKVTLQGTSPSFDSLSKALILLKKYPNLASVELKNASEALSQNGSVGISFEIDAVVNKTAYNKK